VTCRPFVDSSSVIDGDHQRVVVGVAIVFRAAPVTAVITHSDWRRCCVTDGPRRCSGCALGLSGSVTDVRAMGGAALGLKVGEPFER